MSGGRRRGVRTLVASLAVLAARAVPLPALQFGAIADVGAGQATWDQTGAGDLTQAGLAASYRASSLLGLRPELLADLALSSNPSERTAVGWDVGARLDTPGARTGAWLALALGGAGVNAPTAALTRLEGGVRRTVGRTGLHVWLSRTSYGSGPVAHGSLGQDTLPGSDTLSGTSGRRVVDYTDLGSRATVGLGRYELGLSLVRRLGGTAIRRTAWEASALWWMTPQLGLVGATGHSLPQFGLAVPGARYGTLGLRLALGAPPRTGHSGSTTPAAGRPAAPRLVLATSRRIAFDGPAAATAEVMGDFTDWQPRALVPDGPGRWTLPLALAPGVHHLNVRFDGGAWTVPAGTVAEDDGFGGKVGLFVVR